MSIEEQAKRVKELIDIAKGAEYVYLKKAGETIKTCFMELFEKYPKLNSISWVQYTPYFNDGDKCIFGIWFDVNGYDDSGWGPEEKDDNADGMTSSERDLIFKDIYNIRKMIGKKAFKKVFDDGVKVTVTKDDLKIESYDHE